MNFAHRLKKHIKETLKRDHSTQEPHERTSRKVSLLSYKGVADLYPDDFAVQEYMFEGFRDVCRLYGYEEYTASVLEPLELFRAKSSDEIIRSQIYSFTDKGGREVALRPEMTPTLARMVGKRIHDIPLPARLFTIPNVFRYEAPQRGRSREHYQLNVDLIGPRVAQADAEVIAIAYSIFRRFGAEESDFTIRINSRALLSDLFEYLGIARESHTALFRILDQKEKLARHDFERELAVHVGHDTLHSLLNFVENPILILEKFASEDNVDIKDSAKELSAVMRDLRTLSIGNVEFRPTLSRGFDYYTGIVFEIFDADKANPRSLAGGGRYDNLIGSLIGRDVPCFGFGLGNITFLDFLTVHGLLPEMQKRVDLYLIPVPMLPLTEIAKAASTFRELGVKVATDYSGRKVEDMLRSLDRRSVSFVSVVGEDEVADGKFKVRDTATREEFVGSREECAAIILGKVREY